MILKFKEKLAKFDWPNHIWIILDKLSDNISMLFWSCVARIQLCLHGTKCVGKNFKVKGRIHLFTRRKDSIKIGDNVIFVSRFRSNHVGIINPCVLDTLMGGEIKIGNNTGLSGVILSSRSSIVVGDNVKMGGNVRIFDHNFHSLNWENRRSGLLDINDVRTDHVVIGDDVFIGTNSVVLKGVTIGDRSIIAAGSVVTKNVNNDEVWGGNPARFIRYIKQ